MAVVTIDISAMREMIDGLSVAKDRVLDFGERLKRKWNTAYMTARQGVVPVPWSVIETAWLWFDRQRTMLQNRLDLAMLIAYGTLTFTQGMGADGRDQVRVMDTDIEAFERGREYAEKIRDSVMTNSDWDKVIAAAGSGDSNFAAGLFSALPPQEIADQVASLSNQFRDSTSWDTYKGYRLQGGLASYEEWVSGHGDLYETKIAALGDLLGMASLGTPGLTSDYATQIVEVMTQCPSMSPAAMSLVLEHGRYDTSFAFRIADALYDYETGPDFPGWSEALNSMNIFVMDAHRNPSTDPMTGVMSMLGNNPEAALEFLTDGTETADGSVADVEKIQHLFTTRNWEQGYTNILSVWSSALHALGGPADLSHADQNTWMQTASVSTAVMTALQDNHGFNAETVDDPARLELATTLATLLPQLTASACADKSGCVNPGDDSYAMASFYGTGQQWPVVNPRQMDAYLGLMGLAGATPDGALVLAQASQNTQAQILAIIHQAVQGGEVNTGDVSLDKFVLLGVDQIVTIQGWTDGSGTGYTIGQAMQEDQHIRDTIGGVTTDTGAVFTAVGFFPGVGTAIGSVGAAVVSAADIIGVDNAIADRIATHYGTALQQGTQDQQAAVTGVQNELLPGFGMQLREWGIPFTNDDISFYTGKYTQAYEVGSSKAGEWAVRPK